MGILHRLAQSVSLFGYPRTYSEIGTKPLSRRGRARDLGVSSRLEPMEQRLLLTTLMGGESFTYTDAHAKQIVVTLQGNTIAELIASVQSSDGTLLFGNIGGRITGTTANPINRNGTIIGNGSLPVGLDVNAGAKEDIYTVAGVPERSVGANPLDINFMALAATQTGDVYGFNVYLGANLVGSNPAVPGTIIEVVKFDKGTDPAAVPPTVAGRAHVVVNLEQTVRLADFYDTSKTPAVAIVPKHSAITAITAAAFNPVDGLIYFVAVGTTVDPKTNKSDIVQALYTFNPTSNAVVALAGSFADVTGAKPITAIAFDQTAAGVAPANNQGNLWVFRQNNGKGELLKIPLVGGTPINSDGITTTLTVTSGFGAAAVPATGITGLSIINDNQTAAEPFIYASDNTGTSHQLLRVDLATGNGTPWGDMSDNYDPNLADKNYKGAYRGQNIQDIAWNPTQLNPFTGGLGVLMGTDASTDDLLYIDSQFRISAGDVFAIHVAQSDITSAIAVQGPTLYTGNFGGFQPVAPPANTGVAYLGALVSLPDNTPNVPQVVGTMTNTIGLRPMAYSTSATGTLSTMLTAGLEVGRSLETIYQPGKDKLFDTLLGNGLTSVSGMAAGRDGTLWGINSSLTLNEDQLFQIDEATGKVTGTPTAITYSKAGVIVNLVGVQGMDFGSINLDGTELLYAVYNLGDGNGPTLGTINTATGRFTKTAVLSLGGVTARVKALSFAPGSGSIPGKQGLYVVAVPQPNNPDQYVFEVNPTTGAQLHKSTGPIAYAAVDADGNPITVDLNVGAADFNANGQLIVLDRNTGRLQDANLTTGEAGKIWSTAPGSMNATIGALTYDPVLDRYLAIDNVTGQTAGPNGASSTSLLVRISDFTQTNSDAQNLGRFAFDGTVTGKVYVSGSIGQFYAGWLVTGKARNPNPGQSRDPAEEALLNPDYADNFHVGGDIQNLQVLASIGTDGVPGNVGVPNFNTSFAITAQGKIGAINTLGSFYGKATAADENVIPNLTDGNASPGYKTILQANGLPPITVYQPNAGPTQELERYALLRNFPIYSFASLVPNGNNPPSFPRSRNFGYLVETDMNGGPNPFSNDTYDTAQYVGSLRNMTSGQSDVVHVQGILQAAGPNSGKGPDQADYYAFALMAGQTITVSLGKPQLSVGILDPEGRLIATDINAPGGTFRFTADRPGVYRAAVWLKAQFVNTPAINSVPANLTPPVYRNYDYNLLLTGVGDLAIGAIVARNTITVPSVSGGYGIVATHGDIGAIVANSGHNVTDSNLNSVFGLAIENRRAKGDVGISNGNLRTLEGGSLGSLGQILKPDLSPIISVSNGGIGLLRATQLDGVMQVFATSDKNIQTIDAAGELAGIYKTNQGFGNIRAGKITYGHYGPYNWTQFSANADGTGADGTIDLIDIDGNCGSVMNGGPVITTGLGGNVRFMRVRGQTYQDTYFASGSSGNLGEIKHAPGEVVYLVDDSGAVLTLTPTKSSVATITNTNTKALSLGTLTTLTYGVEGSGGVVIINVTSTSGLTVDAAPGGSGRSAEIGRITVDPTDAIPIIVNNKSIPLPDPSSNALGVNITINSTGSSRVDVFDITTSDPPKPDTKISTGVGEGTINTITNNTGGDIVSVAAGDVGSIICHGNIGSTYNTTGAAVLPIKILRATLSQPLATFTLVYPFVDQRTGLVFVRNDRGANVGGIIADKAVGNVVVYRKPRPTEGGIIGTVAANNDGVQDQNDLTAFEGINGPIVAYGSQMTTFHDTTTYKYPMDQAIGEVRIGAGILPTGTGAMSMAGIYGDGEILSVTGTYADIRGDIISQDSIGTIHLTNGSVINNIIATYTDFAMSSAVWFNLVSTVRKGDTPQHPNNINNPNYEIGAVLIDGAGGGIIGAIFQAENIGNVTVGAGGFGILKTDFMLPAGGVMDKMIAGGYGIRATTFTGASLHTVAATGNGIAMPLASVEPSARPNQFNNAFVPYGNDSLSSATDVALYMNADEIGTTTGVIYNVIATGSRDLGTLSAYAISGIIGPPSAYTVFNFANSTGTMTVATSVQVVLMVTGTLGFCAIGTDATNFDLEVAGYIGGIAIGGSVVQNNAFAGTTSLLMAKGPSGDIAYISVGGDLGGAVVIDGRIGGISIGKPGVGGAAGTGDFTGRIQINGNRPGVPSVLDYIKVNGAINGGALDLHGNVGTIEVAGDLNNLAGNGALIVRGNLNHLIVGSDLATSATLLAPLTVEGDLLAVDVTGALDSTLLVKGSLGRLTIIADTAALNTDILKGNIDVRGAIGNITLLNGNLAGKIVAGKLISTILVYNGNLTGEVSSALGDITTVTVTNGDLTGKITAPNGNIYLVYTNGTSANMTTTTRISARSMSYLWVTGSIAGGSQVTIADNLLYLYAGSDFSAGATVQAGSLTTLTTGRDALGNVTAGMGTTYTTLKVGRDFGGTSSFTGSVYAVITRDLVAGSVLSTYSNLYGLYVSGSATGQILVDGAITTIGVVGSLHDAVVTSGTGITTVNVIGAMNNSLIQAGLARGNDHLFGTNDMGEQAVMADINYLVVGSMTNSIVTAGGNINTFASFQKLDNSSVSSGLVLQGAQIANLLVGAATPLPLSVPANVSTARQGATMLHGNIVFGYAGATGLTNHSAFTAGVGPSAAGVFDNVNSCVNNSLTGGRSTLITAAAADGTSFKLANTANGYAVSTVGYTVDNNAATSITAAAPLTGGVVVGTATTTTTFTVNDGGQTLKVTLAGPAGATVKIFNEAPGSHSYSLLIDGGGSAAPLVVTVTSSAPGTLDLDRVLTTDNTNLYSLVANCDLRGDGIASTPDLWIDSDILTFSVRNLPNDAAWTGHMGGYVGFLTVNQEGPGLLRIGGTVYNLTVNSSIGNPFYETKSNVTDNITQLATDSAGNTWEYAAGKLRAVNVNTGVTGPQQTVRTILTNQQLTITGMDFSSTDVLYGVATLNNLSPIVAVGKLSAAGDSLHALAANAAGQVFAIATITDPADSQNYDNLVQVDTTTGSFTVIGKLRDPFNNTFTNNVLALTFASDGTLRALLNDRDGNGAAAAPGSGVALAKIAITDPTSSGFVKLSDPTVGKDALGAVSVTGGLATDSYVALAYNTTDTLYAVRHTAAGVERLVSLVITSNAGASTVAIGATNSVLNLPGAVNTQIVGGGFDKDNNFIALNINTGVGTKRELIGFTIAGTANAQFLTAQGLINTNLAAFATYTNTVTHITTSYGYTTDAVNGGTFYTSPGTVSTLGTINPATGDFTQLLPLAQNAAGLALAAPAVSLAIDTANANHVYVVTGDNKLVEYSSADGSLLNAGPIGTIRDNLTGDSLAVTHIDFDATNRLVGINSGLNRLLQISLLTTPINGQNYAMATGLTDAGSVNSTDLTALTYSPTAGAFYSYSQALRDIVQFRGTSASTEGGIVANNFNSIVLPGANFGGRIAATGLASGPSITSVMASGTGTFTGQIVTPGNIGTFIRVGGDFGGAVVAGGDLTAAWVVSANLVSGGIFAASGTLSTLNITRAGGVGGDLAGTIFAANAGTITIYHNENLGALLDIVKIAGTVNIQGTVDGTVRLGSVATFIAAGQLTGNVTVTGDAGTLYVLNGTALGSLLLADQNINGKLYVTGTIAGVVAARRNVAEAWLANVDHSLVSFGGDVNVLMTSGTVTDSVISAGTWVGADGIYNTADDVIYGGTIKAAYFGGVFTDSVLVAGVLPQMGTTVAAKNNLPADNHVYIGFPAAPNFADVSSAEAGGIVTSRIEALAFALPTVSTNIANGLLSAAVSADGFGTTLISAIIPQVTLSDPTGAPDVAVNSKGTSLVTRLSASQISVTFSEPVDTATLSRTTITVKSGAKTFQNLNFSYRTQTANDGSVQGVLIISEPNNFDDPGMANSLTVILQGGAATPAVVPTTITDRTGLRSALYNFNQDGVTLGDPFGSVFAATTTYST